MSFALSDAMLYDKDKGGMIVIDTPIEDRIDASLPCSFSWMVEFDWSSDDKSTVTCTVSLRDGGNAKPPSTTKADFGPGSGAAAISLPEFRVTVTGTYTVRLYVGDTCPWSKDVLVSDSSK